MVQGQRIHLNKYFSLLIFIVIVVILSSIIIGCCGGTTFHDPADAFSETEGISLNDTDLKLLAEKMVQSLLSSQVIQQGGTYVAKIWVADIQNATSEYIDNKGIVDKISIALLKNGKVSLVDRSTIVQKIAQDKITVDLNHIDVENAVKLGKMIGVDYVLLGHLNSREGKDSNDKKYVYYRFDMRLVDMESKILWMDDKELKKVRDN